MTQAESQFTARRSVTVGIFCLVVAFLLSVLSGVWIWYGSFPSLLFPVALALVDLVVGLAMLRPLHFRVVVDELGIRSEGHAAWALPTDEIEAAGVLSGRHPTLWARPTGRVSQRSRGYSESPTAPAGSHLVPVAPGDAAALERILVELGFADGSARIERERLRSGLLAVAGRSRPQTAPGTGESQPLRGARRAAPEGEEPQQSVAASPARALPAEDERETAAAPVPAARGID